MSNSIPLSKYILSSLFALCITWGNLSAQVYVTPDKLQWTDFKGQPDPSSKFFAHVYWNVSYRYTYAPISLNKPDSVRVFLKPEYVLEDRAWIKKGRESDRLLKHERGHLRFAELLVLEFMNQINNKTFHRSVVQSRVDSAFKTLLAKYTAIEKQYDKETDHMNNEAGQKKWDETLKNWKAELSSGQSRNK